MRETQFRGSFKDKINYRNNIYREYLEKDKQQVDYMKLQNRININ